MQTSGRHALTGIGFFQGPVADKIELAPSSTVTKHGIVSSIWMFARPSPSIFLACRYAATSIVMSMPLSDAIKSCRVVRPAGSKLVEPSELSCR